MWQAVLQSTFQRLSNYLLAMVAVPRFCRSGNQSPQSRDLGTRLTHRKMNFYSLPLAFLLLRGGEYLGTIWLLAWHGELIFFLEF